MPACPIMPRRSRRSARPRSSSARRWRPGPTWSATRRRTTCCSCRTPCRRRPSRRSRRRSRRALERAARSAVRRVRRGAGRRRLDRPGPPRGHDRGPRRRGQGAAPGHRGRIRRARIETYEWAAAHVELLGGERRSGCGRGWSIAHFKQWTTARARPAARGGLGLRAASDNMVAEPGFYVPEIDWRRTARRVLTLEWLDGIKLCDRDELIAAGHDPQGAGRRPWSAPSFARRWSTAISTPTCTRAICSRCPTGAIAAIDFGIMGRIDRQARLWLAEILYGLITGNYRRVAEIHFEAQYVPPHHNVDEFATALRAVGEPIRGLPVKDISVGRMLDGPVLDHPRFRHADPAAPAAAAEDDGDGGRRRDRARSRHQHVGNGRALPQGLAADRAWPGSLLRRPDRRHGARASS